MYTTAFQGRGFGLFPILHFGYPYKMKGIITYLHVFGPGANWKFIRLHMYEEIVGSEHFDLLKALEFYFGPQPAIISLTSKSPQIPKTCWWTFCWQKFVKNPEITTSKMPKVTVTVLRFWPQFRFLALFTDWHILMWQDKMSKAIPKLRPDYSDSA